MFPRSFNDFVTPMPGQFNPRPIPHWLGSQTGPGFAEMPGLPFASQQSRPFRDWHVGGPPAKPPMWGGRGGGGGGGGGGGSGSGRAQQQRYQQPPGPSRSQLSLKRAADGKFVGRLNQPMLQPRPIPPPHLLPAGDSFVCRDCNISCGSRDDLEFHLKGKKHARVVEDSKNPSPYYCRVCNVRCNSEEIFQEHISGRKHQMKMSEQPVGPGVAPTVTTVVEKALKSMLGVSSLDLRASEKPSAYYCDLCSVTIPDRRAFALHVKSRAHKKALSNLEFQTLKDCKDSSVYCEACDMFLHPKIMMNHKRKLSPKSFTYPTTEQPTNTQMDHSNPLYSDDDYRGQRRLNEGGSIPSLAHLMTDSQCDICHCSLEKPEVALAHYRSSIHSELLVDAMVLAMGEKNANMLETAAKEKSEFYCEVCDVLCTSQLNFDAHLDGFKHNQNINSSADDPKGIWATEISQFDKVKPIGGEAEGGKPDEAGSVHSLAEEAEDVQIGDN